MSIHRSSIRSRPSLCVLFCVALGGLACSSSSGLGGGVEATAERSLAPQGPGAVFASAQAAAVDALAWCYLESLSRPISARRARGGAIHAVQGGFSYDVPRVEQRPGGVLAYPLSRSDVAHFRHYPVRRTALNGFASFRSEARRLVDRVDPVSRPFFFLTPERRLHVYDASAVDARPLARVQFGTLRGASAVAIRVPVDPMEARPLALEGGPF